MGSLLHCALQLLVHAPRPLSLVGLSRQTGIVRVLLVDTSQSHAEGVDTGRGLLNLVGLCSLVLGPGV